jgi:hypothetical protein
MNGRVFSLGVAIDTPALSASRASSAMKRTFIFFIIRAR